MGFQFRLGEEAFAAVITEEFEVPSMSSHVGEEVTPITESFLTLSARKFAIIRNARRSTTAGGRVPATARFQPAQRGMVAGVIDDVKGVSSTQKAGCFDGSVKAVMTTICGHHWLSKVSQVI